MQRIQKRQILKSYETEKKITELQLSLVKNQLDPHFTLNALNAIVHAGRNNKIDKVEEGLIRFAGLYRNMLITAGELHRSLEEELTFTENYLALERLRFADAFDYKIHVHPEVDPSMMVPKMIIQVYAENAVKHGLAPKESGGKLRIAVSTSPISTEIVISDNGMGRGYAASEEKKHSETYTSTGKGLVLMKEFYDLYRRYYNRTIESKITDVFDPDGSPAGTSVLISISLRHEQTKKDQTLVRVVIIDDESHAVAGLRAMLSKEQAYRFIGGNKQS
jgi:sensor histidine kinase YesM